jgi:hypothetical protein
MAHIYEAESENRQKLEAFIRPKAAELWNDHEKMVKNEPKLLLKWKCIMFGAVAAILVLIFWPGLLGGLYDGVKNWVEALSDFCWSYEIDPKIHTMDLIPWLLHWPLAMLLGVICAIAGLILYWTQGILAFLILALLFLLLGILAILGWSQQDYIKDRVANYTFSDAWEDAKKYLPEDLQGLRSGMDGEDRALEMVKSLPDDTSVFVNLVVRYDGLKNETDLIVVSPSGLTIVEVKDFSGTLMGDLSDKELTRRKLSRKGNAYDSMEDNPVKQIGAPTYRLANYLRSKGIHTEVRNCAMFTHESVELQLTDRTGLAQKCPVFTWRDKNAFLQHLYSSTRYRLSGEQIKKITQELKKLM